MIATEAIYGSGVEGAVEEYCTGEDGGELSALCWG